MDMVNKHRMEDWQEHIKNKLGNEIWLTVAEYSTDDSQEIYFYSALIHKDLKEKVLSDVSSEFLMGYGVPGIIWFGDSQKSEYFRYGNYENIEPIVIHRSFNGIKNSYLEVAEEFRHFNNLFYDKDNNIYIKYDDNGDEEEVIKIDSKKVQIKISLIKEYLSIKNMCLVIYYDIDRYYTRTIEELGLKEEMQENKEEDYYYRLHFHNIDYRHDDKISRVNILGKKIIHGLKDYSIDSWGEIKREYTDYIISIDNDGKEVNYTCNEDNLANFYGKNPGAPNYLTPVFFRREILNKYYSDTSKYTVEDGYLHCKGFWGLRMDNNHDKYVIVFLGDLGKLSYKEQLYWKSFNIPPDGGISEVAFKRNILAEWTNSEKSEFIFKSKYTKFQENWNEKYKWDLYKPFKDGDIYVMDALRIPLSNSQQEFDQQASFLSKVLIESINEKEIGKYIAKEANDKSISKLDKFLEYHSVNQEKRVKLISFLRNLRALRSGEGHRKGKYYSDALKYFNPEGKNIIESFDEVLKRAIEYLDTLTKELLINNHSKV